MQNLTTHRANTIFRKTEKGRDEIARRHTGLNPNQRRMLILFDGSKNMEAISATISAMMDRHELANIVAFLVREGLVTASDTIRADSRSPVVAPKKAAETVTAPRGQPAAPPANPPIANSAITSARERGQTAIPEKRLELTSEALVEVDPIIIRQVKDFMTTTTQTYLGLLGAGVIQHIERAKDGKQLISVVGQWHMALRDSKHGKRFAGPYLDQVTQALLTNSGTESLHE